MCVDANQTLKRYLCCAGPNINVPTEFLKALSPQHAAQLFAVKLLTAKPIDKLAVFVFPMADKRSYTFVISTSCRPNGEPSLNAIEEKACAGYPELRARVLDGVAKYGNISPLDNRDFLREAREELLDALFYLRVSNSGLIGRVLVALCKCSLEITKLAR